LCQCHVPWVWQFLYHACDLSDKCVDDQNTVSRHENCSLLALAEVHLLDSLA
jgi:hypothetical protein